MVKLGKHSPVGDGRVVRGVETPGLVGLSYEDMAGLRILLEDLKRWKDEADALRRITDFNMLEAEKRFREKLWVGRWVPPGVPAPV